VRFPVSVNQRKYDDEWSRRWYGKDWQRNVEKEHEMSDTYEISIVSTVFKPVPNDDPQRQINSQCYKRSQKTDKGGEGHEDCASSGSESDTELLPSRKK
jgi:hypothetical protein